MAPLSKSEAESCQCLLKECEMFNRLSPQQLSKVVSRMEARVLNRNESLQEQGELCDRFFLIESGDIRRTRRENDKSHVVQFAIQAKSINSMRIIEGVPVHNTVKCVADKCKFYEMKRNEFLDLLKTEPDITVRISEGLCDQIRNGSRKYATPLLQQQQQEINYPAVAIAAGIESYYRSALNAQINARLTGVRAAMFPNMHVQVPVRIAYISGFKGLRVWFDKKIDPDQYSHPTAVRLAMAVAPGIIMTPISSVLEAANAGHLNSESMATRWMRGIVARTGREIVFGLGLNNLSDYFEEMFQPVFPTHPMAANAVGSLTAGVVAGYFSHVPHNISTYKLMEPNRSYFDLYRMFVDKSTPPFINDMVKTWHPLARDFTRTLTATLFPRGLLVRTTQIVGSFVILNGTINYLHLKDEHKIQRYLSQKV